MTKVKPKPCPWCKGKKVRVFVRDPKTIYVECTRSTCWASGPLAETEEKAVEQWNAGPKHCLGKITRL